MRGTRQCEATSGGGARRWRPTCADHVQQTTRWAMGRGHGEHPPLPVERSHAGNHRRLLDTGGPQQGAEAGVALLVRRARKVGRVVWEETRELPPDLHLHLPGLELGLQDTHEVGIERRDRMHELRLPRLIAKPGTKTAHVPRRARECFRVRRGRWRRGGRVSRERCPRAEHLLASALLGWLLVAFGGGCRRARARPGHRSRPLWCHDDVRARLCRGQDPAGEHKGHKGRRCARGRSGDAAAPAPV